MVQFTANKRLIAGLFIFLWVGFLAGAYIWAHNPINSSIFSALAQTLLSIFMWLSICWLATALGIMILAKLNLEEADALAELAIAAGLGLGLLAIFISLLGFAGLFNTIVGWTVILLLIFVTIRHWRPLFVKLKSAIQFPHPENHLQWLVLIFALVSLSYTFIFALTPPIAWDSLTYHLVGPQIYIETGTYAHPLDIPQLGFPLLGQMLFTLGMLLMSDITSALFHFGYGLFTLALVIVLTRRIFSRDAVWFAVLALLSVPLLLSLMSWSYVDVMLLFYTTAIFFIFYQWWHTKKTGWLLILGMMIGFSGGLKYTAIAMPIAVTIGIIISSRGDGLLTIVKRLALVGGVALILVLPWLLENYLTTGNPVYPVFLTEAKFWNEGRAWWYSRPGTGVLVTSPISLLLAPLEASILDGTLAGDAFDGTIGPLILGVIFLMPFVWHNFSRSQKKIIGFLFLFAGTAYFTWLAAIARSALQLRIRLLLPTFGLFAILAGVILFYIEKYKHPQLDVGWLVRIVLSLFLIMLLLSRTLNFIFFNPVPVLVGIESEDEFLERQLGTYTQVLTAVNELPPDSTVQFLWETRSYHCQVTCDPDPILDTWLNLTQFYGYSASEIAELWQEKGITHVLINNAGLDFIIEANFDPVTDADLQEWQTFAENYLQAIEAWPDEYTLYEFSP